MKRLSNIVAAFGLALAAAFGWAWAAARAELGSLRADLASSRTIERAIDGDTIVLDGEEHVRILGIDCPELSEKTEAGGWRRIAEPDPAGLEAREWLRSLEGCAVRVTLGVRRRDRYGRTLAHVYVLPDGPDLACEILRRGWAKIMAIAPNTKRYGDWKVAASAAKK